MRFNQTIGSELVSSGCSQGLQSIAISTPKVLLVPYRKHHVRRYHEWMEDEVRSILIPENHADSHSISEKSQLLIA